MGASRPACTRACGETFTFETLECRRHFSGTKHGFLTLPKGYSFTSVAPLSPAVSIKDQDLRNFILYHEGDYAYPYLDSGGNLTVGVGINIDPDTNKAKAVAAYRTIKDQPNLTDDQAVMQLRQLKRRAGPPGSKKASKKYLLKNETQDLALFDEKLAEAISDATTTVNLVGKGVFAGLNHRQQIACVDLAYNMGIGTEPGRGFNSLVTFRVALGLHDWVTAGNALRRAGIADIRKNEDIHFVQDVLDHFVLSASAPSANDLGQPMLLQGQALTVSESPVDWAGNPVTLDYNNFLDPIHHDPSKFAAARANELKWYSGMTALPPDKSTYNVFLSGADVLTKGVPVTIADPLWNISTSAFASYAGLPVPKTATLNWGIDGPTVQGPYGPQSTFTNYHATPVITAHNLSIQISGTDGSSHIQLNLAAPFQSDLRPDGSGVSYYDMNGSKNAWLIDDGNGLKSHKLTSGSAGTLVVYWQATDSIASMYSSAGSITSTIVNADFDGTHRDVSIDAEFPNLPSIPQPVGFGSQNVTWEIIPIDGSDSFDNHSSSVNVAVDKSGTVRIEGSQDSEGGFAMSLAVPQSSQHNSDGTTTQFYDLSNAANSLIVDDFGDFGNTMTGPGNVAVTLGTSGQVLEVICSARMSLTQQTQQNDYTHPTSRSVDVDITLDTGYHGGGAL
jgi:GH24 family phage-related lysozyme (muramidase)